MKGTLVTTAVDKTTGLNYASYLIKYRNKFWIATYDIAHEMLVQMQEATLLEEKVPEHVQRAVSEWLV